MDIIIEIILEVFIGGASEAVGEKRLPLPARVAAAALLLVFFIGIVGLFALLAVKSKSPVAAGIAVFMLAGAAAVMMKKSERDSVPLFILRADEERKLGPVNP